MAPRLPGSPSNADALAAAIDAAVRDAAVRLSLPSGAGDVRVEHVEDRQWPDSALGCPREGELYLQVLTPGFVVVLTVAGARLEYHADTRGRVVLCQEA